LLPQGNQASSLRVVETHEHINQSFSRMILCSYTSICREDWIFDSIATDHMNFMAKYLTKQKPFTKPSKLPLPSG